MTSAEVAASGSIIDPEKVVTFPKGIPGFEKYTRYRIFHKQESDLNVYWLESCDDADITFTLVDPIHYGLHYALDLNDEEQDVMKVGDPKNLAILLIISKSDTAEVGFNANIGGPIIINIENQIGIQKVLLGTKVLPTVVEK